MRNAVGGVCVMLVLAGCAGGGGRSAARPTPDDVPNTGLEVLAAGLSEGRAAKREPRGEAMDAARAPASPAVTEDERSALARQAATDLEAFFAARSEAAGGSAAAAPPAEVREATATILEEAARAWETPPEAAGAAAMPPPAGRAPSFADADPGAALAQRMAGLLAEPAERRIPDAVALAAIEAVSPGALANLEVPGGSLHDALSPSERAALIAARDRVLANPSAANEALLRGLSKHPAPALRIARGVLCTRVLGFGKYDPFTTDTFAAGRALRVIVYTEIENFASRGAVAGDPVQAGVPLGEQVTVDLTQSLSLYHDPSGLLAWHRPAQKVVETTRGKRRDFYLIHTVELPASLTVGKYVLKATVTDKTTGASDEVAMPINIVAR